MSVPYPWQQSVWTELRNSLQNRRLSHSLLLTGQVGVGKTQLARELARTGLCEAPELTACGQCGSCHQFSAGAHPDWLEVEKPADKREILIDQIRDFCAEIQLTASQPRGRYAHIRNADNLNRASANALLKTLEEPPRGVTIILSVTNLSRIPATIRSRCSRVSIAMPTEAQMRAFFATDDALPAQFLRRVGPLALSESESTLDSLVQAESEWEQVLDRVERDHDAISAAQAIDDTQLDAFLSWWQGRLLDQLKSGRKGMVLRRLWDALIKVRQDGQGSFNRLLALEGLFILYLDLLARQERA